MPGLELNLGAIKLEVFGDSELVCGWVEGVTKVEDFSAFRMVGEVQEILKNLWGEGRGGRDEGTRAVGEAHFS